MDDTRADVIYVWLIIKEVSLNLKFLADRDKEIWFETSRCLGRCSYSICTKQHLPAPWHFLRSCKLLLAITMRNGEGEFLSLGDVG